MPKRIMEGKVVSNACDKTVTVEVERRVKDELYKKVVRRSAKYAAHDENNTCQVGDVVQIEECPRISKRKAWTVISGGTGTAKKAAPKKETKAAEKKAPAKETKKAAAKKDEKKETKAKKPAAKKTAAKKEDK